MKNFKKLISIIFSLSIIFTMCTSNLRTFSFPHDLSRYLENALNDLRYECKNENNFTHLCTAEDLTYEKINNMTLDEFKAKYKSDYLNMDELYAISKLKCGEKHVTIHNGDVHDEYFRVNAVDEILNFFKTKYNYGLKDYKKDSCKRMAQYGAVGSIIGGLFSYVCSLFDKPQKSKNIESKNEPQQKNVTEKNKFPKFIGILLGTMGFGAIGALFGWDKAFSDHLHAKQRYKDAKHYASWAFNKNPYNTDHWTDNDVLKLSINLMDYPCRHDGDYEYYNVGIGFSEEEQKTINEEYETLYKRVNNEIYKKTVD